MSKTKIGKLGHYMLVKGDYNELNNHELLLAKEEGYYILRKKLNTGKIETFVVVPLKDFNEKTLI